MAKQFIVKELVGTDRQGHQLYRDVEIPDGKWVAHASISFVHEEEWDLDEEDDLGDHLYVCEEHRHQIVGSAPQGRYVLSRYHNTRHYNNGRSSSGSTDFFLVGDQPFGVIYEEKENGQRTGGLWFSCARQVHKGELGRRPPIQRPQFAREAPPEFPQEISGITGKPIHQRDRKRGKHGWARLADVAALVHMTPEEVARRYFAFTHAEHPALQVLFASQREQIHGQPVPRNSWITFHEHDLPRLFDRNPAEIWIRQGFANVVLYLHHLGHTPPLPQEEDIKIAANG